MERTTYYFAYATLMNRGEMARRCPEAVPVGCACLEEHVLVWPRISGVMGGGVPSLRCAPGRRVWGVVWRLPLRCLPDLDRCEGYQGCPSRDLCTRAELEVQLEEGRPVRAVCYLCSGPLGVQYPPAEQIVDLMLRGARDFGLPEDYVDGLERLVPA